MYFIDEIRDVMIEKVEAEKQSLNSSRKQTF